MFRFNISPKVKRVLLVALGISFVIGIIYLIIDAYNTKKAKERLKKNINEAIDNLETSSSHFSNLAGSMPTPVLAIDQHSSSATTEPAILETKILPLFGRKTKQELIESNQYDWSLHNDNFPLKLGSAGTRVRKLQVWLNNMNEGLRLPINGHFDIATREALRGFKSCDYVNKKKWDNYGLDNIIA